MATATDGKSCKIEGCQHTYRAKGYCDRHYKKWRQGDLKKSRYKICSYENCHKKRYLHGFCEEHFKSVYNIKEESPPKEVAPKQEAKSESNAVSAQEVKKEQPAQESTPDAKPQEEEKKV